MDPALIAAEHVDNEVLPTVYSSAGVVLNDHWATMRVWGFVSNRLFDGAVLEYHSPGELRELVDEVLADPAGARQRAERGRKMVLANHTMDHRASELIAACTRADG